MAKRVYVHPQNPALLIKVVKRSGRSTWYKRMRRYGPFLPVLREIKEFLALHSGDPADLRLVERIVGFVETDLGLGLVVEALLDRDGQCAPTLATLVVSGRFQRDTHRLLDDFFAGIIESDLIVGDFSVNNIVFAHDRHDGSDRFVLVDGLGDKLFIPLNTLSRAFNRFTKARRVARMRRKIGMLTTSPDIATLRSRLA